MIKYICGALLFLHLGNVFGYEANIDNEDAIRAVINGRWYWVDDPVLEEKYVINLANGASLPVRHTDLSRTGEASVKIQVPSNFDGIENNSYAYNRSEVIVGNALPLEQVHWLAFSVNFQSQFPNPDNWFAFSQVWQKDAGNPLIGFFVTTEGKLKITIRNNQVPAGSGIDLYTDTKPIMKGKWIDFVMTFRGSLTDDGYLKIWRKLTDEECYERLVDESRINIGKKYLSGGVIATELVIYPKFGIYRGGSNLNHQIWFDDIKYKDTGTFMPRNTPICGSLE